MDRPPASVIAAFGGDPDSAARLPGGEGKTWRCGGIVLKPSAEPAYVEWTARLAAAVAGDRRVRVATPRQAADGSWVVEGWFATGWLDGNHRSDGWDRALEVADAFHDAVGRADIDVPDFLRAPTNPWRRGDAVAWREAEPDPDWHASVLAMLERLAPHLDQPWKGDQPQPVHVDIGGNILFADESGLPPAVIDLSMHVRPAAYANAVLVADAVAWGGAPPSLAIGYLARQADGDQLLARAIAFRVATVALLWSDNAIRADAEVDGYAPVAALLRTDVRRD